MDNLVVLQSEIIEFLTNENDVIAITLYIENAFDDIWTQTYSWKAKQNKYYG